MFRTHLGGRFEIAAYLLLLLGALGDWVSTAKGLSAGLVEGNMLAASLMEASLWIQTDLIMVGVCILVPYLANRLVGGRSAKILYMFPLVAGFFKVAVSLWNINLLM
ncbi:hypothetical protein E2P71_05460 [Candidatus Bathyarchaeota archaeon]|nr:hypothetical protein E2P71_05460 [Candidatus Bathyarchaeota archaeon]